MPSCRQGAVRPGRSVVTGLRLPGVARRRRCVAPVERVAFDRVDGRVCDPSSRAATRQGGGVDSRLRLRRVELFWKSNVWD